MKSMKYFIMMMIFSINLFSEEYDFEREYAYEEKCVNVIEKRRFIPGRISFWENYPKIWWQGHLWNVIMIFHNDECDCEANVFYD